MPKSLSSGMDLKLDTYPQGGGGGGPGGGGPGGSNDVLLQAEALTFAIKQAESAFAIKRAE